jgi:S1-C subfamily serine protease
MSDRYFTLLFSLLSLSVYSQIIEIEVKTPKNKAAVYSETKCFGRTPNYRRLNIKKTEDIYVVGDNIHQKIHLTKESDGAVFIVDTIVKKEVEYGNVSFGKLEFRSQDVVVANTELVAYSMSEYNSACKLYVESTECLVKNASSDFVLNGIVNWEKRLYKVGMADFRNYAILTEVKWTLTTRKGSTVVFEKEIVGSAFRRNFISTSDQPNNPLVQSSGLKMFKEALISSFYNCLIDSALQNAIDSFDLKSVGHNLNINVADVLKFDKPDAYCSTLKEGIASTVSIKTASGFGSGFIISENGYILTNAHVVGEDDNVSVSFSNGMKVNADVIRKDDDRDIALIQVPLEGLIPFGLRGDTEDLEIGEEVYAIGTPEDMSLSQSVSKGIVSGFRNDGQSFIQTDVSINRGNSGGPLLDEKSNVIGVVTAKLVGMGTEGIGFAIPIQSALDALNVEF